MGFWGELGKELGKAALQGVAEGLEKSKQQREAQKRQDIMREFIVHEREIQSEGEIIVRAIISKRLIGDARGRL